MLTGTSQTCCALHFWLAMLAVLKYSCASRPELLPLATVFEVPLLDCLRITTH
jgi:hypothetical protein